MLLVPRGPGAGWGGGNGEGNAPRTPPARAPPPRTTARGPGPGGPAPPCPSISAIFSGLVDAGITATYGRPRTRAKYASETAVEPLEASTIVVPSSIQPLHRP